MAVHKIKQGLTLPITGAPEQSVSEASQPRHVAIVAADYVGMKPTMHVNDGDAVKRGQLLFEDKKTPGVRYTSPASGKVQGVHRGAKRALQSVVIELDQPELDGRGDHVQFNEFHSKHPSELNGDEVKALLLESGVWTALRTRPFSRVANPETKPNSIFVTAADSNPLTADPGVVLAGRGDDFERGLIALSKLTDGKVYVCKAPETSLQVPGDSRIQVEDFSGPHPSGTAGVHIHTLDPVNNKKLVWHVGYQDVAAIGKLFDTGEIDVERVVALGGPGVKNPRLLRTRLGASLNDLTADELNSDDEMRIISGSVLAGRTSQGDVLGYLGRYANQVSVLKEGRERYLLGWALPGGDKFSVLPFFLSKLMPGKKFEMTTTTNGSHRAIVPLGVYEKVFPIDIPVSFLLKTLVMQDLEYAEHLGVLELDEEDVALCSFVCPGKYEYGTHLRSLLTTLEKEG